MKDVLTEQAIDRTFKYLEEEIARLKEEARDPSVRSLSPLKNGRSRLKLSKKEEVVV